MGPGTRDRGRGTARFDLEDACNPRVPPHNTPLGRPPGGSPWKTSKPSAPSREATSSTPAQPSSKTAIRALPYACPSRSTKSSPTGHIIGCGWKPPARRWSRRPTRSFSTLRPPRKRTKRPNGWPLEVFVCSECTNRYVAGDAMYASLR